MSTPYTGPGLHVPGDSVTFVEPARVALRPLPGSFLGTLVPTTELRDFHVSLAHRANHPPEYVVLCIDAINDEDQRSGKVVAQPGELVAVFAGVPTYYPIRHNGQSRAMCSWGGVFLLLEPEPPKGQA